MDNKIHNRAADNIRILSAAMVQKAKSGHPGGAMGGADFVEVLYSRFLNFDPDDMTWPLRDRFFLDPGHMSPMLYSILALTGNYSLEELSNFRQWGSPTPGHPEVDPPGVLRIPPVHWARVIQWLWELQLLSDLWWRDLASGCPTKPIRLFRMEVFRRRYRRVQAA